MLCYKAYKFIIYPNKEQKVLVDKSTLSYADCSKDLIPLKKAKDFLKEVDSISLQQSLRHLDNAYQNFFRDKKVGFPKFKSRK